MTKRDNIEQLKGLMTNEKFWVLRGGHCNGYVYQGLNSKTGGIIALKDSDYTQAVCFSDSSIRNAVVLSGEYSNYEVGTIMIEQLAQEIETVKEVYLKK